MLIRFASDHVFAFPVSSVFVSVTVTGPVLPASTGLHNAQTRERVAARKFARQLSQKGCPCGVLTKGAGRDSLKMA